LLALVVTVQKAISSLESIPKQAKMFRCIIRVSMIEHRISHGVMILQKS
jgi:hypothetical protein